MARKWLIPLVLSLLLFVSLFWGWDLRQKLNDCQKINQELIEEIEKKSYQTSEEKNYLKEGDSLDSFFALSSLEGKKIYLDSNRVWLLIFISTACPSCLETAQDVFYALNRYQKRGLEIISVSRDIIEDLNELVRSSHWHIPVARDESGQAYRLFRVATEPYFILLDRGQVRFKSDALNFERREAELEDLIKKALENR
ncbi:MAG: peroxiredoxin family protein [Candidatus Saccharicenans sp.]